MSKWTPELIKIWVMDNIAEETGYTDATAETELEPLKWAFDEIKRALKKDFEIDVPLESFQTIADVIEFIGQSIASSH